jgi:hypothetical protein
MQRRAAQSANIFGGDCYRAGCFARIFMPTDFEIKPPIFGSIQNLRVDNHARKGYNMSGKKD